MKSKTGNAKGFTLLELVVAFAIFLIIGGATMRLLRQQIPTTSSQQDQSTLNLGLRNSIALMQIDVVNAGTGYYPGANIPDWPIGVTILNNVAGSNCYNASTNTYGPTCFDQLNVIATDVNVPPFHPAPAGGSVDTSQNNTITVTPPNGISATAFAANFHNGDELLWLQQHSGGSTPLTTTVLSADGVANSGTGTVQLTYSLTTNQGVNTLDNLPANGGQTGLLIANNGDLGNPSTTLTNLFGPNDWVLKLNPIKYYVDASDPTNPKLIRQQGVHTTAPIDIIAQQVIGFKVGAMTWNNAAGDDQTRYIFDAQNGYNNDWSTVRSIMVSVIGRTNPDQSTHFNNSFDGGPYKVQAVSAVISPRNLSMNDQ